MTKPERERIDWWALRQLRAQVTQDIKEFLPADFYEVHLPLHKDLDETGHYSSELSWGHKAGDLGRRLFFQQHAPMTPRQVAASGVLMNLGLLAGAEATKGASSTL